MPPILPPPSHRRDPPPTSHRTSPIANATQPTQCAQPSPTDPALPLEPEQPPRWPHPRAAATRPQWPCPGQPPHASPGPGSNHPDRDGLRLRPLANSSRRPGRWPRPPDDGGPYPAPPSPTHAAPGAGPGPSQRPPDRSGPHLRHQPTRDPTNPRSPPHTGLALRGDYPTTAASPSRTTVTPPHLPNPPHPFQKIHTLLKNLPTCRMMMR